MLKLHLNLGLEEVLTFHILLKVIPMKIIISTEVSTFIPLQEESLTLEPIFIWVCMVL
jgi:hypothetical protein